MKRLLIQTVINLAVLLIIQGCNQDFGIPYEDPGKIYFKYPKILNAMGDETLHDVDSLIYTMYKIPAAMMEDTIRIRVKTTGMRADHPRKFKVEIVQDSSVVNVGEECEPLAEYYTFPANQGEADFPFVVRREGLAKVLFSSILFRIVPTDDLGIAFIEYSTIRLNCSLWPQEPDEWWIVAFKIGGYHPLKYLKLMEYYGSSEIDFFGDIQRIEYLCVLVARYFKENVVLDPFSGERITVE